MYKDYAELRKSIGKIQKSATNPHFKNTYVELNTALQVIDENIEKHNFICFLQVPVTIEGKNYLNTKLIHKDGGVIEGNLELITTKQDPQMLGSSLTYARRYSLLTILGLQAVDDDGNAGAGIEPKKQSPLTGSEKNTMHDEASIKQHLLQIKGLINKASSLEKLEEVKKDKEFVSCMNYLKKHSAEGLKEAGDYGLERKKQLGG